VFEGDGDMRAFVAARGFRSIRRLDRQESTEHRLGNYVAEDFIPAGVGDLGRSPGRVDIGR